MLGGGVLRLIQNDKAVVQRPAAHVGQRRHLNVAAFQIFLVGFRPQHVEQGVVQRPQVGIHLGLQIAGQKAQLLSRLHRRPGQNDAVNLLGPESAHRHGHRQVGFAGARGAHAQDHRIVADRLHILLLADGFRLDRMALGGEADAAVRRQLRQLIHAVLVGQHQHIPDVLLA